MSLWHISIESDERLPMFPGEILILRALHALARVAGKVMLLFSIVDDHLHLVSAGDIEFTRRLRQSILQALTPIADVALGASWVGPVRGRKHLLRLVRYHVVQVVKHNVQRAHPALWSGSCFQDLAGARLLPGLELQTGENLPREQIKAFACQEVGLPGFSAPPIHVDVLRTLGIARIKAAAASALAADPDFAGRSKAVVLARRVTARLGMLAGISKREIGWALNLSRQGLCRLLQAKVPDALLNAARSRLSIEEEVDLRQRRMIRSTSSR